MGMETWKLDMEHGNMKHEAWGSMKHEHKET
jgi:hypothetical protein